MKTKVYVGLGGNVGDTITVMGQAISLMKEHEHISNVDISNFYRTTPVSDIPQEDYINAVCCFETDLTARELLEELCLIETQLGKEPKGKGEPRLIDLDILFYGTQKVQEPDLIVPHPKWDERLFVLKPLSDLTETIDLPRPEENMETIHLNLKEMLTAFPNIHKESVEEVVHETSTS